MTKSQRFLTTYLLFICFFFIPGCGYNFRETGKPIGLVIDSIAIPIITSTSSNIGFEADFTKIIREEFISHANVPLLSQEKAHMLLIGNVSEIKTEALTSDLQRVNVKGHSTFYGLTNNRRLKITLDIQLQERGSRRVIWNEKGMTEKAAFSVGDDPLANRHNQQEALRKIARRLAKRIYLKTMERF